jgi:hypothetical protein
MLMHTGQTASSTTPSRPSSITRLPTLKDCLRGSVVFICGKSEMTMSNKESRQDRTGGRGFFISDRLAKRGIENRKTRPKYWSAWQEDPKLSGVVASFESALGARLSVIGVSDTGVPLLNITSPKRSIRSRAPKVGLVWGRWPRECGAFVTCWLPGRPVVPMPSNPYLESEGESNAHI